MKTEYEVRLLDLEFDIMMKKVKALGAVRLGSYH